MERKKGRLQILFEHAKQRKLFPLTGNQLYHLQEEALINQGIEPAYELNYFHALLSQWFRGTAQSRGAERGKKLGIYSYNMK